MRHVDPLDTAGVGRADGALVGAGAEPLLDAGADTHVRLAGPDVLAGRGREGRGGGGGRQGERQGGADETAEEDDRGSAAAAGERAVRGHDCLQARVGDVAVERANDRCLPRRWRPEEGARHEHDTSNARA